ncbi:hypothetical protein AKO1_006848 [Acrasis kona]
MILNHTVLCAYNSSSGKTTRFRICEIEYYLTTTGEPDIHEDPFSHCHPLQSKHGVWYFHQSHGDSNNDNYRGGSYKGMDFTFNIENSPSTYGGILIRGVESISSNTYTDGPSKTVDTILKATGADSIHDLISNKFAHKDQDIQSISIEKQRSDYPLYLEYFTHPVEKPIFSSSRVGMSLKQNNLHQPRSRYVVKAYRHVINPHVIKKGKNQLVVTMYHRLMTNKAKSKNVAFSEVGSKERLGVISQIVRNLGVTNKNAEKYIKDYESGRKNLVKMEDKKIDLTTEAMENFGRIPNGSQLCEMHGMFANFI